MRSWPPEKVRDQLWEEIPVRKEDALSQERVASLAVIFSKGQGWHKPACLLVGSTWKENRNMQRWKTARWREGKKWHILGGSTGMGAGRGLTMRWAWRLWPIFFSAEPLAGMRYIHGQTVVKNERLTLKTCILSSNTSTKPKVLSAVTTGLLHSFNCHSDSFLNTIAQHLLIRFLYNPKYWGGNIRVGTIHIYWGWWTYTYYLLPYRGPLSQSYILWVPQHTWGWKHFFPGNK